MFKGTSGQSSRRPLRLLSLKAQVQTEREERSPDTPHELPPATAGTPPADGDASSSVPDDADRPRCPLLQIAAAIGQCQRDIRDLAAVVRQVVGQCAALEHLAERNRVLAERFHEREVLGLVFRTLIAMNDRHRESLAHTRRRLRAAGANGHTRKFKRLEAEGKAKEADALVIDQVLAQFGVEPFSEPSSTFVPSTQHCLQRVPIEDQARHGEIARRFANGYRRDDHVIRREQVSVYVPTESTPQPKQEIV